MTRDLKIVLPLILAVLAVWVFYTVWRDAPAPGKNLPEWAKTAARTDGEGGGGDHLAVSCLCATSYSSIGAMLSAYKDSDVAALAGLEAQGKGIILTEGTRVKVLSREAGVAAVLVDSGPQKGEKCWVWGKFVG